MAHRLAKLLNTTPELWLGLQQDVDLEKAMKASEEDYRKIRPITVTDINLELKPFRSGR